jgi:hypothetical protein
MRALAFALALAAAAPAFASPQRCAQIAGGVVVNVVVADPAAGLPGVDCSNPAAQIGWSFANGVYAPPLAGPPVYQTAGLSFVQFLALFTPAEQAAIVGSTDAQVRLLILMADGAAALDLSNAQVVAGVNRLVTLQLISAARMATILSGAPPS